MRITPEDCVMKYDTDGLVDLVNSKILSWTNVQLTVNSKGSELY